MTPTIRKSQDGFTMIEILVTLSIFLAVLLAIFQVFDTGQATYNRGTKKQDIQQNARMAMDEIVKRMRVAGYISENFDTDTTNDVTLGNLGVYVATNNVLALYGDLDGTSQITPTPALPWSNVFLFCFYKKNATDLTGVLLSKKGDRATLANYQCNCPAPLTDCTQGGDVLADNVTDLKFTYFNANNAQIASPVDTIGLDGIGLPAGTVNLPNSILGATPNRVSIRTVVVKLQVTESVVRENAQRYTLTSTIRLRNQN
jgi:prepilin-type N-terminal cleavage/methylation domain-containing protein